MIIRSASTKDCQAIYSLYQNEKWLSFTEEKVTSLFSTNLSHYLVLEEDQKILSTPMIAAVRPAATAIPTIIGMVRAKSRAAAPGIIKYPAG